MLTNVEALSTELSDIPTKPESASATSEKKDYSKFCRFFKKGFCGFGEKCLYSHGKPKNRPRQGNCPFYKKASCKFATKCWYSHIGPNGKPYRKPDPYNKFIVVGPSGFEETRDAQETKPRRSFKRPQNLEIVPKNCFYYEKKGECKYKDEDKCWYTHNEPSVQEPPSDVPCYETDPELEPGPDHNKMCYDFTFDVCEFGDACAYVHGDICQFCDLALLHPFDEQQRRDHLEACEIFFLEDMEISFAFMRSKIHTCGICLENVWNTEKKLYNDWKFGIQDECFHVFCLNCIRQWRRKKSEKEKRRKDCPLCRAESSVVVPSTYWFRDEDEKKRWVQAYKDAVNNKPCRFYARGRCENEDKCHYLHSGYVPVPPEAESQDGIWGDLESNNELPSHDQEAPGNSADGTAHLTVGRDRQDARRQNVPDTDALDDLPPDDQPNEDLALQSGEEVSTSNLANDHQWDDSLQQVNIVDDVDERNVEQQVVQSLDNSQNISAEDQSNEDSVLQTDEQTGSSNFGEEMLTSENQSHEDSVLHSDEQTGSSNLVADTEHQFDNLEQVDVIDGQKADEQGPDSASDSSSHDKPHNLP